MRSIIAALPTIIYAVNFIFAIFIIFYDRNERTASATIAWIMVLFLLPVVGLILYIFFSQNITRYKVSKLSQYEQIQADDELNTQIEEMDSNTFPYANESEEKWKRLIKLNQKYSHAYLTQHNKIKVFSDGTEKYEALMNDIDNAKHYINIEYFIIKPDRVGLELIKALTKKAREGVEVRLLIDAIGCSSLKPHHYSRLVNAGGKVAVFFPPRFLKFNWQLNYRNHRKIVTIDDAIGYIGGNNIGLEYLGISRKFTGWRDTHLKIEGEAVEDLNNRFVLDWRFAGKENLEFSQYDYSRAVRDSSSVQIVSCGPDSPETEIKQTYLNMIMAAKKSVYIQTPYFIPDESIFEALKAAALSGVDVRIMIPYKPDHPFVYWATYQNVGKLLSSGVKVFIYEGGFLHAKTIVVDEEVASVGSANFDIRSFKLSFETNAIIYDRNCAGELHNIYLDDISHSRELTKIKYDSRSVWIKIKESVGRLGMDIL